MPMTHIYIASAAGANATAISAAHHASEAQDAACTAMMDSFTSQAATLKARQTYAECVHRLNPPSPVSHAGDKTAVGVLLGATVICAVIGAMFFDRDFGRLGGAFVGALMGLVGTFVAGIAAAAVLFVIS